MARYGNVTPAESAPWDLHDLNDFAQAVAKIVKEENKAPPRGRKR